MITADHGFIQVFDHEVPVALPQVINRIGAIVEQPKFFPTFSGRKNLRILATGIGVPKRGWARCCPRSDSATAGGTSSGPTPSA